MDVVRIVDVGRVPLRDYCGHLALATWTAGWVDRDNARYVLLRMEWERASWGGASGSFRIVPSQRSRRLSSAVLHILCLVSARTAGWSDYATTNRGRSGRVFGPAGIQ